ncbi:MAG: mechanosensitive ion channel family protein [Saprospiraceae bacterium]
MNEIFQHILFTISNRDFTVGQLTAALTSILLSWVLYKLISQRLLQRYFKIEKYKTEDKDKIFRIVKYLFFLIALTGVILSLQLNHEFFSNEKISFKVATVLETLIIIQLARLLDWIIAKVLQYNYQKTHNAEIKEHPEGKKYLEREMEPSTSRTVQSVVYILAVILILQNFNLDYTIFSFDSYNFKISNIFWSALILLVAQLLIWILTQLILFNYYRNNTVNVGSQYAINQLLKYVIYLMAFLMAIESLGIKMTVVWGGAAALLVGIGLGLQQTFNDLISGIILLFERTVEVGHMVQLDEMVGTVKKIGLRTSIIETRDNITVVVPNSKLVTDNVINWSHFDDKVRFKIIIGVAYGSDTQLVKSLLLDVAKKNIYVLEYPNPLIRFTDFGDSALIFELHFWSRNYIVIEDVKSDIRFEIDRVFRENDIQIPFPQRDVWLRK